MPNSFLAKFTLTLTCLDAASVMYAVMLCPALICFQSLASATLEVGMLWKYASVRKIILK